MALGIMTGIIGLIMLIFLIRMLLAVIREHKEIKHVVAMRKEEDSDVREKRKIPAFVDKDLI